MAGMDFFTGTGLFANLGGSVGTITSVMLLIFAIIIIFTIVGIVCYFLILVPKKYPIKVLIRRKRTDGVTLTWDRIGLMKNKKEKNHWWQFKKCKDKISTIEFNKFLEISGNKKILLIDSPSQGEYDVAQWSGSEITSTKDPHLEYMASIEGISAKDKYETDNVWAKYAPIISIMTMGLAMVMVIIFLISLLDQVMEVGEYLGQVATTNYDTMVLLKDIIQNSTITPIHNSSVVINSTSI